MVVFIANFSVGNNPIFDESRWLKQKNTIDEKWKNASGVRRLECHKSETIYAVKVAKSQKVLILISFSSSNKIARNLMSSEKHREGTRGVVPDLYVITFKFEIPQQPVKIGK